MRKVREGFEIPEGLSPEGLKAAWVITDFFAKARRTGTGGCRTFYSPQQWKDRKEEFGCDSVLLVVHDGGDVAAVINPDYGCDPRVRERLNTRLAEAGFYLEPCTCWYAAVYPIHRDEEVPV